MHCKINILALATALCWPLAARAEESTPDQAPRQDLRPVRVVNGQVKVDGFVNDWRGVASIQTEALTRGEREYDWTGPRDLSMVAQAQVDRQMLYLAVEVRDNLVVGPRGAKKGDRIELWFDGGDSAGKGRLRMLEISIGDIEAGGKPTARWGYGLGGGAPRGLELDGAVRAPEGQVAGYFFEIGIPLSEVSDPTPGLEPIGVALIARDWDYDDPNEDEAAVATAPFDARKARDPRTMGRLLLREVAELSAGFFRKVPEAAQRPPVATAWADVGGDSRREYVALHDRYVLVVGEGLGEGDFYYYTLPWTARHRPGALELRDLTGDGKAELLVRYTIHHEDVGVEQELLAIFHYGQDRLLLAFQSELANRGQGWTIQNELQIKAAPNKPALLTVKARKLEGALEISDYPDVDREDVVDWDRLLLPWQSAQERRYTWEGFQFIKEAQ